MNNKQLVQTLQRAGFRGSALRTAYGIAKRESGGRARAFNPDRSTGDQSYGLFQINMLGGLGPARRKQFGLSSNEDLYDPNVNARAAYRMSKGGKDFGAWGIGPNAYRSGAGYDTIASHVAGFPGGGGGGAGGGFDLPDIAGSLGGGGKGGLPDIAGSLGSSDAPQAGANIPGFDLATAPSFGGGGRRGAQQPAGLADIQGLMGSNSVGARAVKAAATQLGKPYVFGSGPDTSSFDCSDLVQWAYRQQGINIPRDTRGQQAALPLKPWSQLRPGDPIYRKSGGHVVIYAGNGKVIAAPHTGTVVQYQDLSNFPQSDWEVRSIN